MDPKQLGPYHIGRKLGRGGMGTVYEGYDEAANLRAAVKVLSTGLAGDAAFRERFEAEIESLKKLRHPNIVRLYGYGEQEGLLFYAMELVQGVSLEDELQQGRRFEWREVTKFAIKLCKALKHAHDHGVVHRDLKPANLLLTAEGELKLSDFGIAKLFGSTGMTVEGGIIGTAEYMAPEQADGRHVTYRCDYYSLGSVLYALLSGRPPFKAKSFVEMLQLQRFAEPEPVRRYAPTVPEEFERVVGEMLVKDPQERLTNPVLIARRLSAMEHALTLRESRAPGGESDSGDFDVDPQGATGSTGKGSVSVGSGRIGDTMAAPDVPAGTSAGTGAVFTGGASAARLNPSAKTASDPSATAVHASQADDSYAIEEPPAPATHFTAVTERDLTRPLDSDEPTRAPIGQIIAVSVALLGLLGLGWWLWLPPSADKLYSKIEEIVGDGDTRNLIHAELPIQEFVERFPNDERTPQLREWQDEIELDRVRHKILSNRTKPEDRTPLERALVEAFRYAALEPERGIARLRDVLAMYPNVAITGASESSAADSATSGPDERTRRGLKLARSELERLERQVEAYTAGERDWLKQRLDEADALAAKKPEAAQAMYAAIIDRYEHKPWAKEEVERAQERMKKLPAASKSKTASPKTAPSSPTAGATASE